MIGFLANLVSLVMQLLERQSKFPSNKRQVEDPSRKKNPLLFDQQEVALGSASMRSLLCLLRWFR